MILGIIRKKYRSKLYVEPGFLKAERTLLKMMLENNEYLQYIEERISEKRLYFTRT